MERQQEPSTPAAGQSSLDRYPRPAVTVDVVVFTVLTPPGERAPRLHVLLVRRARPPFEGYWAIPGGFVGIDEPLEAAAVRELEEETGVRDAYLEQLYTFGDPGRDPRGRVISVAYLALLRVDRTRVRGGDDAAEARWFPWEAVPFDRLAFDHGEILRCARRRLAAKIEYAPVAFELLPDVFTRAEVYRIYRAVAGVECESGAFERRNFYKALDALAAEGLIVPADGPTGRPGPGRPGKLFRFRGDPRTAFPGRRIRAPAVRPAGPPP